MSEPDAAFMKLRIERAALVRWLDGKPPLPSRWADWRDIGGKWYFDAGVKDIRDVSAPELTEQLIDCEGRLAHYPTNRAALRDLVDYGEAPNLKRIAYDPTTDDFVAGTLTYSENLIDFLVFFTLARGAADALGPERHGIALVHNYVFGDDSEHITQAALRLGPSGVSSFLADDEKQSAAGAFQAIADQMMGDPAKSPPPVDQLDTLK